jgi:DNA polymerase-3 subunit beta
MKFAIPQKELSIALARCAAIAGKMTSMPILSNVLIVPCAGLLKVSATDLEVGYTTAIGGMIWEDGMEDGCAPFLLDAKTLAACVKAIPVGEVTFTVTDNVAVISGGTISFTLTGLDAEDFPAMANNTEELTLTIDPAGLSQSLRNVAYCHSTDATKPNLNGCLLQLEYNLEGDLFAVTSATDGHRLCLDTNSLVFEDEETSDLSPPGQFIPPALIKGIIIPAKGVAELVKLTGSGPGVLGIIGNSLTVSLGDEVLTIQLSEGVYPDVKRIIPENPGHIIQTKRQALIDALERCRIITNKDTRGVDLCALGHVMVITSAIPQIGAESTDHVTVEIEGMPPILRINIDYLLQALGNISTASVELRITDELSPMIINPVGTDFPQAIVMPMRGA